MNDLFAWKRNRLSSQFFLFFPDRFLLVLTCDKRLRLTVVVSRKNFDEVDKLLDEKYFGLHKKSNLRTSKTPLFDKSADFIVLTQLFLGNENLIFFFPSLNIELLDGVFV